MINNKENKKKKRLIIKRLLLVSILFLLIFFLIFKFFTHDIKNIFIENNSIFADNEIKEIIKLDIGDNYFSLSEKKIKEKLEKNEYIKTAEVTKKLFGKITINIDEYKPLFYRYSNNHLIIEGNTEITNPQEGISAPILINYVDEDYVEDFIEEFEKLELKTINRISEIEYQPNEIDKGRFLLYMNDGNLVYITIEKIYNLDKYDEILPTLNDQKGILYLDLGNYFEPFDL